MSSICTNCGASLEAGTNFCGACGSAVGARTATSQNIVQPHPLLPVALERRYHGLRIISFLYKILAVVTAIGGTITGLSAASMTSLLPNSAQFGAAGATINGIIFLVSLCISLCIALFLWASAEMIHVLIDIEENTRRSARFAV